MPPWLYVPPNQRPEFDAMILADHGDEDVRVCGLTRVERAYSVLRKLGARRVTIARDETERSAIERWFDSAPPVALVIVQARDQVVHTDLIAPLLDANIQLARAVTPSGSDAGAAFADATHAHSLAVAVANDAKLSVWRAQTSVHAVVHGNIGRHIASTQRKRAEAVRHLCQMVHKPQDGPVTRWLYRPVSLRLSRLLVKTPLTPNHISYIVAALGAVGIYLTAHASYSNVIAGSAIILAAGYLDGCDGELARLTLRSSRFGAWLDTITDELTTLGYLVALGYHNYLRHPTLWVAISVGVGVAASVIAIYVIYYYLIVVHGSANSQDYVHRLVIVPNDDATRTKKRSDSSNANLTLPAFALQPAPPSHSRYIARLPYCLRLVITFAPHIVRRDFINWVAFALAAVQLTHISYAIMVIGATGAMLVVVDDHRRLRRQLAQLRAAG